MTTGADDTPTYRFPEIGTLLGASMGVIISPGWVIIGAFLGFAIGLHWADSHTM